MGSLTAEGAEDAEVGMNACVCCKGFSREVLLLAGIRGASRARSFRPRILARGASVGVTLGVIPSPEARAHSRQRFENSASLCALRGENVSRLKPPQHTPCGGSCSLHSPSCQSCPSMQKMPPPPPPNKPWWRCGFGSLPAHTHSRQRFENSASLCALRGEHFSRLKPRQHTPCGDWASQPRELHLSS